MHKLQWKTIDGSGFSIDKSGCVLVIGSSGTCIYIIHAIFDTCEIGIIFYYIIHNYLQPEFHNATGIQEHYIVQLIFSSHNFKTSTMNPSYDWWARRSNRGS